MSDCLHFEELISLSVSGELSPEENEALRAHLSSCELCRLTMARERRLWELIVRSRGAAPAASPELSERLAAGARTAAVAGRSPGRSRWRIWAAAAAAAALLLIAGLLYFQGAPGPVAEVKAGRLLVKQGELWSEAKRLSAGDVFMVPGDPGSGARLKLADGSRLDLERGASGWLGRGFVVRSAGGRQVKLLVGALTAEVAKRRGAFVVEAPGGTVTATGTRFWVRSGPSKGKEEEVMGKREIVSGTLAAALAVAVFEGSVLVKPAGAAEAVPVNAGQDAAAAPGAPARVTERTVASAVPADALFLVAAAGRAKWMKALENSNLGAAYREEQVKAFLAPLIAKIEAAVAGQKTKLETNVMNLVKVADVEKALTGETGLAVLGTRPKAEGGGEDPIVLFVAEVGENPQPFENLMDDFVARVRQAAPQADLRARAYRGTDLRTFTVDQTTIAYARDKGYFLFAFDAASVERGIDCLEEEAPSLASAPAFKKADGALLAASANLATILKRERAKNPEKQDWKNLDALGLGAVGNLSYRLEFDKPLFRERLSLGVDKTEGLFSLLKETKPVDAAKLAADAPADALIFFAGNLPAGKFLDTLFKVMGEISPPDAEKGRKELLKAKAQGLDLEAILKDALTGEVALWASTPAGSPLPDVVLVCRLKDNGPVEGLIQFLAREAFRSVAWQKASAELQEELKPVADPVERNRKIKELAAKYRAEFRLEPTEMAGGKMFTLPAEKGNPFIISILLQGDRMIVASNPMALQRAAAKPPASASLAARTEFKDALAALPPGAVGVNFVDVPRAFGLAYNTGVPFLMVRFGAEAKEKWGLDLLKLPPGEAITKHLVPEVGALYADEKGLRLEARSNAPRAALVTALGVFLKRNQGPGDQPPGPVQPKRRTDPEPEVF